MHYKRAETIGTTAPHPRSLDPASVGQALRGGPGDAHDIEAFWQAISLQAAARAATFANGSAAISKSRSGAPHIIGIQQAGGPLDLEEHVSPGRSFKLVLALAIGVAVFAGVVYFMLGGNLLASLLPSPA
jgi:hypothetical protein